jgi:RimJ/RimL family protein N-acetyltransferase
MDPSTSDAEASVITLSDGAVTLRPWSMQDAWFLAVANADPAIRRNNGTLDRRGYPAPPMSTGDAEDVIREFTSSWEAFATTGTPGAGVAFAIVDAGSGDLAGCCGLDDWSPSDVAQLGYWIGPRARGRGYATRAATLLTRWLFECGAARVVLKIVAGNDASVAVARRAGFQCEGTMRDHGVWQGERCDVLLFAAVAIDWDVHARPLPRDRT